MTQAGMWLEKNYPYDELVDGVGQSAANKLWDGVAAVAVQPWWCDYAAVAAMSGVRTGGSQAPVVNSWVIASRVSMPHLVAVDR